LNIVPVGTTETTSGCISGKVIGSNTGVYVGGLPRDFIINRRSRDDRQRVTSLNINIRL